MSSQSTGQTRKRRRQAVVCTECRRRKIACDRNSPCTQCLQSGSPCTYYTSYNSFALQGDLASQDANINGHITGNLTGSQGTCPLDSRPQLLSLPHHYQNGFYEPAEIGMPLTTTASVDMEMHQWYEASPFVSLLHPLNISFDTLNLPSSDVSSEDC